MSLYGKYINECFGRQEIEGDGWFMTYKIKQPYCHLVDIYVVPEKRKSGLGKEIVNKLEIIAKDNGCDKMLTTIDKNNVKDDNLKLAKSCGYKLFKRNDIGLFLIKEL